MTNSFKKGEYIWISVWNKIEDNEHICKKDNLMNQFFIATFDQIDNGKKKNLKVEIDRLVCGTNILKETITVSNNNKTRLDI